MTRIECPKGQWTTITSGISNVSFNLINKYPDPIQACVYKINYGLSLPAIDTDEFVLITMDKSEFAHTIEFNNTTIANVYVMSLYDNGSVVI